MKRKLTMRELLECKGKHKISLTTADDYFTARTCELAGLDIIAGGSDTSVEEMCHVLAQLRRGAPNTLIGTNIPTSIAYVSDSEAIRCAMLALENGADVIYSSGNSISRFRAMAQLGIPCIGHIGLVPRQSTWIGGLRPVGKTYEEALQVYRNALEFQEAGAIAVEMECVPERVATEITKRVKILTFSCGSGRFCDGQFLYSCDMLGTHDGYYPRHAKKYCDFFNDAVKAFQTFKREIDNGEFPGPNNLIKIDDEQFDLFIRNT